jgi:hypothetical protein|tara:strand:+ start:7897 stop:8880 length:984 start_codon:yes stop_codon:yes gene_type:complete
MSVDKRIKYDIPQLAKPKGNERQGFRGDDAYGGGRDPSGPSGNKGGGKGNKTSLNTGPSPREKAMGLQGKTGVTDKSLTSGGDGVDRTRTKTIDRLNRIKAVEDLIDRPTFGFDDSAKINLFSPRNIFSGLLSLINPALGFIGRTISNVPEAIQDLRGYNPDGTPRTQEQYEQARRDRQIQGRIDNIMDRQRLGKTFSQKNLDSLMGMTDMYGDKFSPSTAQNVLTVRDLKGFTDSRMGLTDPDVNPIGPQSVNVPSTGIGTIDVNLPGNNLMAGLTKMQKKGLDKKKNVVNMGLFSPQDALDSISPFNDPDDPATLNEVKEYYGIV